MAIVDYLRAPPAAGNPPSLPCILEVDRAPAALLIAPGLVTIALAAELRARAIMAPEVALDAALSLVAAIAALRQPPMARP